MGEVREQGELGVARAARAAGAEAIGFTLGSLVVWSSSGVVDELGTVLVSRVYGSPERLLSPSLGEALAVGAARDCGVKSDVVIVVQEALSPGLAGRLEEVYRKVDEEWSELGLPLKAVRGLPGFPLAVTVDGARLGSSGYTMEGVLAELDKVVPRGAPVIVEVVEYESRGGTLLPETPGGKARAPYTAVAAVVASLAAVAALSKLAKRAGP